MSDIDGNILYDSIKHIILEGEFSGSIVIKLNTDGNGIVFSDSVNLQKENGILINNGLKIGFKLKNNSNSAFSSNITNENEDFSNVDYCVQIPDDIMELYDEGQFSDAFPYTINMLHTAGLYLNDNVHRIDHLNFFRGEILKNPISLIKGGIIIADRVVIDHRGDPVFYDCLIVGRDEDDRLNVSYEPLTNVDDKVVRYIIILGIEELKI